nr:PREDICTED: inositol monophosphatase 2 [Latimeria chalumnae]|eukprot:XP_006008883.1 PREDICTED: inositol monophosphatase 2 [Latimeria chalumnae]
MIEVQEEKSDPWEECLRAAEQIALNAGKVIREALKKDKQVRTKTSAADLVTETDRNVETLIISSLKQKFPTHRFPSVAVSIGFAVNKELELGVIYHCTEQKLYTGRRGHGAFCNGQKLRVSKETDISKALILTEIGPKRDPETLKLFLRNIETLLSAQAHGVRVIGSATLALCHIATGEADAYYQFGLHCWDMAAATVIIREAGGTVIDTSGSPLDLMSRRLVAAGTKEMAQQVVQGLQTIHYERDDDN